MEIGGTLLLYTFRYAIDNCFSLHLNRKLKKKDKEDSLVFYSILEAASMYILEGDYVSNLASILTQTLKSHALLVKSKFFKN